MTIQHKTPRKGNAEGSKGSHVEPEKQTKIGRRKRHKKTKNPFVPKNPALLPQLTSVVFLSNK
jgi:hypothetical protein